MAQEKIKIFNDPVYGFVTIPSEVLLRVIDHPYFQRLRRIKQLGLTDMVYPGALHTRFHHAIGALHLVQEALEILRLKDVPISPEEAEGVCLAVLLHDIGHGPFSHTLEYTLVNGISHEEISGLFIQRLDRELDGVMKVAREIFYDKYPRPFFHQLVSGQLDVDRLDYLRRDSFYTGVSEGTIGSDRIIKMLNVVDDRLVVEEKAIYSIEKFLIARRIMYWQVYLHKTVVGAERLLVMILQRAHELARTGKELFAPPALHYFLYQTIQQQDFQGNSEVLDTFARLDDHDIVVAVKSWMTHPDRTLAFLCNRMINRKLLKVQVTNEPPRKEQLLELHHQVIRGYGISEEEAGFFVFSGKIESRTYNEAKDSIIILQKNGKLKEFGNFSDEQHLSIRSNLVSKYYLCYPKELATKEED